MRRPPPAPRGLEGQSSARDHRIATARPNMALAAGLASARSVRIPTPSRETSAWSSLEHCRDSIKAPAHPFDARLSCDVVTEDLLLNGVEVHYDGPATL